MWCRWCARRWRTCAGARQSVGAVEVRERYEEVPPINLNRELLEWVLENLLSNALTALDKPQGLIEVSVDRRADTEEVVISVSDNGRGMTREEQSRAFEPGYSTKRRGWGLGLALARRVVEEYHAGRIGIRRSAPGEGTSMVIRFPTGAGRQRRPGEFVYQGGCCRR